jgi:hypothetical protein
MSALREGLGPGRLCPLSYRYAANIFNREADFHAETLYVIGGLYGNRAALDAIVALAAREPQPPRMVFNGDFNWFNVDAESFGDINRRVLEHVALRGNVETELAAATSEAGCGCAYPDSVSDAKVDRSNAILAALRNTAARNPPLRTRLGALSTHSVVQVGGLRVGIVHGDAESLAGWRFAHNELDAPGNAAWLAQVFHSARVDVFASSHTCLPAARRFEIGGRVRAVINNGAAGMPNFRATRHGVITRIATSPAPFEALYGLTLHDVYIDAVAVHYDQARWLEEFLANWPVQSVAYASYFQRICEGPDFALAEAAPSAKSATCVA